jgi:syntaxin 16
VIALAGRNDSSFALSLSHTHTLVFLSLFHDCDTVKDNGFQKLTAGGDHDLMLAEEGATGSTTNSGMIQMSTLNKTPPVWVKHVEAVEHSLLTIQSQMKDLQALHSQRVGSVFGKNLDNMEGRIEKMTNEITDEMRVAERHLQAVGKQTATTTTTAEEATVGANVQRSLAKRLQELSVTFRQSQRKYLAEVQAQKTGKVPDPYLMGLLDDTGGGGGTTTTTEGEFFTSQQMAVVDDLTQAVQSRDAEIIQIAKSIEELGTIFKELAVLVIDQGTILDRIDYNMEAVVEHTKTGIQQLERAERAQRSARPLRCIICLSILVFVLLILLILKWR